MSRVSLALALGAAMLLTAPAAAATFVDTAHVDSPLSGVASVLLPRFSGLGPITSVTLSFEGFTVQRRDLGLVEAPLDLPAEDASWTIEFRGPLVDFEPMPGVPPPIPALIGSQLVATQYPAVTVPGDPETPYARFTLVVPVSISGQDADFARYLGTGFNEFTISTDGAFSTTFGGTVTQTITTAGVPEPAAWALLILGFATTGAALRRRLAPAHL